MNLGKKEGRMKKIFRVVWAFLNFLGATTFVAFFLSIGFSNNGKKRPFIGHLSQFWGKWILWGTGLKLEVIGLENIDPEKQYVFIFNHRSLLDVILVMASLPFGLVTMVKKSLKYVPIFGYALWRSRVLFVDRGNPKKREDLVRKILTKIEGTKLSPYIFAEGKRKKGPSEFMTGAFRIAIRTGFPAVPAAIINSEKVLPIGKIFGFDSRVPLKLVIGKPVPTEGMSYCYEDRSQLYSLRGQVQGIIKEMIKKYS